MLTSILTHVSRLPLGNWLITASIFDWYVSQQFSVDRVKCFRQIDETDVQGNFPLSSELLQSVDEEPQSTFDRSERKPHRSSRGILQASQWLLSGTRRYSSTTCPYGQQSKSFCSCCDKIDPSFCNDSCWSHISLLVDSSRFLHVDKGTYRDSTGWTRGDRRSIIRPESSLALTLPTSA